MKKIILTVVITLIVLAGGFTIYMYTGWYDVSQTTPHNGLTKWMIRTTKHHSIDSRLKEIKVPKLDDTTMYIAGFREYNEMCVMCHGAPGIRPDAMVKGLYPKPPEFAKKDDMPDPDEGFWIIKNGIKMTSMPAYGPSHKDAIIWDMTAFLVNKFKKMTPEEYKNWIKKYGEEDDED